MAAYRDGYSESGWVTFLRWLNKSFRLGVFFRVEVRVFWITLILMPLIGLSIYSRAGFSTGEIFLYAALLTLLLYVVVWSHEMGHILAARKVGAWSSLITLSPLGGVAHLGVPAPSPRADVWISLAGPATHLLWLAVFWPLSFVVTPELLRPSGWFFGVPYFVVELLVGLNLWLMVFNLLPIFPLDGGRVLRALLSMRLHPNRATIIAARIGLVGGILLAASALLGGGTWSTIRLLIGISVILACVQEMRAARHGAGPYQVDRRQPWEMDADAWKRGGVDASAGRDGGASPRRRRRQEKAEARRREEQQAQAEELDRVLDRVNEVGMRGLSRRERKVLERASKERRGGR